MADPPPWAAPDGRPPGQRRIVRPVDAPPASPPSPVPPEAVPRPPGPAASAPPAPKAKKGKKGKKQRSRRGTALAVGTVLSPVVIDTEQRRLWAAPIVVPVLGVALALTVINGLRGNSTGTAGVVGPLLVILAGVVAVALVLGVPRRTAAERRRRSRRRYERERQKERRRERSWLIAVRRFRVRAAGGDVLQCRFEGDLAGPEPRDGDHVRVFGRRSRRGHVLVRRMELLSGPEGGVSGEVRATLPAAAASAVWVDRGAQVALAVLALWIARIVLPWFF